MYCVHNGKVCLMLWDTATENYVYIPESTYNKLTPTEKLRYKEEIL